MVNFSSTIIATVVALCLSTVDTKRVRRQAAMNQNLVSTMSTLTSCPPANSDFVFLTSWVSPVSGLTKYYFLSPQPETFFEAHNSCRRRQFQGERMNLVAFESKAEQDYVVSAIWNGTCSVLRTWDFYTGLNALDYLLEGSPQQIPPTAWTWAATGERMTYSNGWNAGEPSRFVRNRNFESCVTLRPMGGPHGLNDDTCTTKWGSICEITPVL